MPRAPRISCTACRNLRPPWRTSRKPPPRQGPTLYLSAYLSAGRICEPRRQQKTGIFQILAGDYRLFRTGSGQIRSPETGHQFAKARHWWAFLRLLRVKSPGAGLPGWRGRMRTLRARPQKRLQTLHNSSQHIRCVAVRCSRPQEQLTETSVPSIRGRDGTSGPLALKPASARPLVMADMDFYRRRGDVRREPDRSTYHRRKCRVRRKVRQIENVPFLGVSATHSGQARPQRGSGFRELVGFAPTGKRRLCTAHTQRRHWGQRPSLRSFRRDTFLRSLLSQHPRSRPDSIIQLRL